MSRNVDRIVCSGCDYEVAEYYRPIRVRFQFDDGSTFETGRARGWCYSCDEYRDVVSLDDSELEGKFMEAQSELKHAEQSRAEVRQTRLRRLINFRKHRALSNDVEHCLREIFKIERLREILRSWESPGRCLECWSRNVATFDFESDGSIPGFKHSCGGDLRLVTDPSDIRYSFNVTVYGVNQQGEFLGQV